MKRFFAISLVLLFISIGSAAGILAGSLNGAVGIVILPACVLVVCTAAAQFGLLVWFQHMIRAWSGQVMKKEKATRKQSSALLDTLTEQIEKDRQEKEQSLDGLKKESQSLTLKLQFLERQKDSTEAILDSIRDAVLVADTQGRLQLANSSAESLFGFTFDPENSHRIEEFVKETAVIEKIKKSLESQIRHVRHEIEIEQEEQVRVYDTVISCIYNSGKEITGVVAVLHDVTREKEVAKAKNDFVSHVSHELKTPLASINAYAEMLVDGEADDKKTIQEFCGIIQSQAQRLNRLIEEILNISRIESGLIKVKKENHSIALVIRDAVEMITSYAQEKNITIHSQAPILYDQTYVDRDMISQVVINLLSNAVKYTPAGGSVTIQSEVDESEGKIHVTVSDTGVGIPPEDVEHVFDKFYRVEANKKCAKGTGLGLNLVKKIVETVHQGRVFVTSAVNEGSTFGFDLPLTQVEAAAGAEDISK